MKQSFYYSYIKDVWSSNFEKVVSGLSSVEDLEFLIKEDKKILFRVNEENLDKVIKILSESVKKGAWHDLVSSDKLVAVFSPTDVRKVLLDTSPEDTTWLKMKDLEPSVRNYKTLREMIDASIYKPYI